MNQPPRSQAQLLSLAILVIGVVIALVVFLTPGDQLLLAFVGGALTALGLVGITLI